MHRRQTESSSSSSALSSASSPTPTPTPTLSSTFSFPEDWNSRHSSLSSRIPPYSVFKDPHAQSYRTFLKLREGRVRGGLSGISGCRLRGREGGTRRVRRRGGGRGRGRGRGRSCGFGVRLRPLTGVGADRRRQQRQRQRQRRGRGRGRGRLVLTSVSGRDQRNRSTHGGSSQEDDRNPLLWLQDEEEGGEEEKAGLIRRSVSMDVDARVADMTEIEKLWDFVGVPTEQRAFFSYYFVFFPRPIEFGGARGGGGASEEKTSDQIQMNPLSQRGHLRSVSSIRVRRRISSSVSVNDAIGIVDPLRRELERLKRAQSRYERVRNLVGLREAKLKALQKLVPDVGGASVASRVGRRRVSISKETKKLKEKGEALAVQKATSLLRRIRLLTSEVVLAIISWRKCYRPFCARGSHGERVSVPRVYSWQDHDDYLLKIQSDLAFFAESVFGTRVDRALRLQNRTRKSLYSSVERERALRAQKIMIREIRLSGLSREQERKRRRLLLSASTTFSTVLVCGWQERFQRHALAVRVIQRACRRFCLRRRMEAKKSHLFRRSQSAKRVRFEADNARDRRLLQRFDRRRRSSRRRRRRGKRSRGRLKKIWRPRRRSRRKKKLLTADADENLTCVLYDDEAMRRNAAVLKIQCVFRGYLAKRIVSLRKRLADEQIEREIRLEKDLLTGVFSSQETKDVEDAAGMGWATQPL